MTGQARRGGRRRVGEGLLAPAALRGQEETSHTARVRIRFTSRPPQLRPTLIHAALGGPLRRNGTPARVAERGVVRPRTWQTPYSLLHERIGDVGWRIN